jgi:transcription elongation factor GreA
MSEKEQYLTKEKIEEFTKELEYLKTDKRKKVAESLEYAKKLGDLSENAEYHEARQEQAEIEDRIMYLESILKNAVIMDAHSGDGVGMGSTVKIKKEGENDARIYKIVGSEEADMTSGKLSNLSPIGSALIGKKEGDKFSVNTPKGKANYSIISIE